MPCIDCLIYHFVVKPKLKKLGKKESEQKKHKI